MKSRLIQVALLVVSVTAVVFAVGLHRENRRLQDRLARATLAAETAAVAEPEPEMPSRTPATVAPPTDEAAVVPEPPQQPNRGDRRDRMERFLSDPQMQAAFRSRIAGRVERDYAGLFRSLDLDEDTIGIFTELMADRESLRFQANMRRRMAGDDPEAQAEIDVWQIESQNSLELSLAEILGDSDYDKFAYYEESLPQRRTVEDLSRRLSYSGTPLTEDRAEKLVGVMAAAEASFSYTDDLSRLSPPERASVTPDQVALYLEERQVLNQAVLEQASTVLEADQLEALAEQQIREVEQLEQQVEVGRRMGERFVRGPGG